MLTNNFESHQPQDIIDPATAEVTRYSLDDPSRPYTKAEREQLEADFKRFYYEQAASEDFQVRQAYATPLPTADELEGTAVDIDMTRLATDATPYTDIEAEMAKVKHPKPDFPVNYQQHIRAELAAALSDFPRWYVAHQPTTDEFMQVLDEIAWAGYDDSLAGIDTAWPARELTPFTEIMAEYTPDVTSCHLFVSSLGRWEYIGQYNSFLAAWVWASIFYGINKYRITRYADLCDQPQPALQTEPDDAPVTTAKKIVAIGKQAPAATSIEWTVASVSAWLSRRIEEVDSIEKGEHKDHKQITASYATQLNIQDYITAYRRLGGTKRYPEILDELTHANRNSVRILHRNTPETLRKMYKAVEAMYKAQHTIAANKERAAQARKALGDGTSRRIA